MPPIFFRFICWCLLLGSTVGFLAELSGHRLPSGIANADKIMHFGIFLVLTWVFHEGFRPAFWKLFTALALYGALIEVMQEYFTRRSGEWLDWLADLAGILAFYLLRKVWHLWRHRPKTVS